jgi:hypothetical protein
MCQKDKAEFGDKIEVTDTITKLSQFAQGKVVVSGSHGGILPGAIAISKGVRAVIFNDAGLGLDESGIGSLLMCEQHNMAVAAVDYMSCRIGNGYDMLNEGIISVVNQVAKKVGVYVGQTCKSAAIKLLNAPQPSAEFRTDFQENREVLDLLDSKRKLILVDSATMIRAEDRDQIVITGSHGGLIGNNPKLAINQPAFAAFYNDAGLGIDDCGISRLPVLDLQGIAGVAIDCMTCRIGSARSALETGVISKLNKTALRLGLDEGVKVGDAITKISI